MKVSVLIPVLNPGAFLQPLVQALLSQQPSPPDEILLLDSGSTDGSIQALPDVEILRVGQVRNFRHGAARNLGIQACRNELVVLITQDAIPASESWMASLIAPFDDPQVAGTYSRQLPRPDCNPVEAFFLHTHFPPGPGLRMCQKEGEALRFQENLFFSNASSAVRREMALKVPFDEHLIMSEDQQFARDALQQGYVIEYTPESQVLHSHEYTFRTALGRYMDSLISLRQIFSDHSLGRSLKMGGGYLHKEIAHLVRHHPGYLLRYLPLFTGKTLGTLLGHMERILPERLLRYFSLHPGYWDREMGPTLLEMEPCSSSDRGFR